MGRIVNFEFDLAQEVEIKAVGMKGFIVAMLLDTEGPAYKVAYWNNGSRASEWMFAKELGAV